MRRISERLLGNVVGPHRGVPFPMAAMSGAPVIGLLRSADKQFADIHAEDLGKAHKQIQRRIAFAVLQMAQIGLVHANTLAELFLRKPVLAP